MAAVSWSDVAGNSDITSRGREGVVPAGVLPKDSDALKPWCRADGRRRLHQEQQ